MNHARHFLMLAAIAAALAVVEILAAAAEGAEHPAVVRIVAEQRCTDRVCASTYGSGTLVDVDGADAVVVTCAHLFRQRADSIVVEFPGGTKIPAKLAGIDAAWDLAALTLNSAHVAFRKPVAIAADYPKPGDRVQSCGYGSDGKYWCNQGRALGYARTARTTTYETLELSGRARDGDSGGPVFNERGELAGVLWGTNGRIVGATYCVRVGKFLGRLFPRLGNRFGGRPTQPVAPGGGYGTQPVAPLVPVRPTQPAGPPVKPPVADPGAPCCPPQECRGLDELRKRVDSLETMRRRMGEIEGSFERTPTLSGLATLQAGLEAKILNVRKLIIGQDAPARAPGLLHAILPGLLAALGWSGPPAMAAIVGLKLLGFVVRRRVGKQKRRWRDSREAGEPPAGEAPPPPPPPPPKKEEPSLPPADPIVLRDDAAPSPQIVRRNREFVEVQVPEARLRAIQMAMDEYVKRHPGARCTIEAIEGYADQFESGFTK